MAHVLTGAAVEAPLRVQKIDVADLKVALAKGLDDFLAWPSHAIFLCIIYPVVGLIVARAALGGAMMPLAFPIVAGFALVVPSRASGSTRFRAGASRGSTARPGTSCSTCSSRPRSAPSRCSA